MKLLIVGLGNPGKEYEETRHNLGCMILEAFAKKNNWEFKKKRDLKGKFAQGNEDGKKVFLLFPLTYMNLSGQSVRKAVDYYKIALSNLLIITDDVALPFGTFRFREKGSSGGHKGLMSIESCLRTQMFQRLRIGIGDREEGLLEDYVLSNFTKDEKGKLPAIIDEGIQFLMDWIKKNQNPNEGNI